MEHREDDRVIEQHKREFAVHLQHHLANYPRVIKLSEINFHGHSCQLTIQSDNEINDLIDETVALDLIFEEAVQQFSHEQHFTDRDGKDFGVITTWESPDINLRGINQNHPIQWIFVLEIFEDGHDFDMEIFIIV